MNEKNDATTYTGRFEMVQLSVLENFKRVFRSLISISTVIKSCGESQLHVYQMAHDMGISAC